MPNKQIPKSRCFVLAWCVTLSRIAKLLRPIWIEPRPCGEEITCLSLLGSRCANWNMQSNGFRRWWNSFSVMCCISYYFEFISTPFFPEYHHVYEADLVNWSLTLQANHHVAFLSGTTFGVYIRFGASGFGKLRSCWSCAKSLMVHINDIKKDKSFGFLFDHLFVAVLFWSLKLSKDAWPPNGVVYNEITSPR